MMPASSVVMHRCFTTLLAAFSFGFGLSAVAAEAPPSLPAFPGATGFAASTATGGRGGTVYHVTNLDDAGPGSLRDAVSQPKRIVVFDVGGYIRLKSILAVKSDITIAGQTAPGEGIGTLGYEVSFSPSSNVIVRYIRFRQGITPGQERKGAINITNGRDMIFDHVSIEWGRWDCVQMSGCTNMTMQDCIIGEGVPPQRFGAIVQSQNVTFFRNLWINNKSRNPKSKGTVQYINNVIYNWGGGGGFVAGHSAADCFHDIVNNYFIAGPESGDGKGAFAQAAETDKVYLSGNYLDTNANGALDGRPVTEANFSRITVLKSPFSSSLPSQIDSAEVALQKVIEGAGCSLHRDSVDARLIDELKSLGKRGKLIADPAEVGGAGEIKGGSAPPDTDNDGIPDAWEAAHGMDASNPQDASRADASGYPMLEVYLNSLVPSERGSGKP